MARRNIGDPIHREADINSPDSPARESAAEWVPLDSLRPWGDNPRKNDGEPVRKVAESIKRFGFGAPIVARKANGEIIAGHTRWKAAKLLGLPAVPVRFVDLDPVQAHLLALADNRTSEESEWDADKLEALLRPLTIDEAMGAGFDLGDIDKILNGDDVAAAQEAIAEVVDVGFTLTLTGPLARQLDVVERIKAALGEMPGIVVTAA